MTNKEFVPGPRSVFLLEPHARWSTQESGTIPIGVLAERVYGRPYNSLLGCQRDHEGLSNGVYTLYELSVEDNYLQALADFDATEVYLGYDPAVGESIFKHGKTALDYWLSISVSNNPAMVTVPGFAPDFADLEGAVFGNQSAADRGFTPSLQGILADLIRRGELPRGDYLFHHWW